MGGFGSSPRVRGKHDAVPAIHGHGRIIPARAGQTQPCRIHRRGVADHPRACGANLVEQGQRQIPAGSSPRVRGKRCDERFDGLHHRIIPARAGQTLSSFLRMCWDPDHPRACGANAGWRGLVKSGNGSSPRVRGKQDHCQRNQLPYRIIPARAGQTFAIQIISLRTTDHPRACGANQGGPADHHHHQGSSPRVRGKPGFDACDVDGFRIIPARAGQTVWACRSSIRRPDHPRACGANAPDTSMRKPTTGSSPRVRGKPGRLSDERRGVRIIPARAGQTTRG